MAKIRRTLPITAKDFFKTQILNQFVELPVHMLSSPIRLVTMAYIVDNLCAKVLIGTDTLAREGASLNLG